MISRSKPRTASPRCAAHCSPGASPKTATKPANGSRRPKHSPRATRDRTATCSWRARWIAARAPIGGMRFRISIECSRSIPTTPWRCVAASSCTTSQACRAPRFRRWKARSRATRARSTCSTCMRRSCACWVARPRRPKSKTVTRRCASMTRASSVKRSSLRPRGATAPPPSAGSIACSTLTQTGFGR